MIAKIAVWAEDRERARRRMHRALGETAVKGITTNTVFLRRLLEAEPFKSGNYHTGSVETLLQETPATPDRDALDVAMAAMVINAYRRDTRAARQIATRDLPRGTTGWRSGPWRARGG